MTLGRKVACSDHNERACLCGISMPGKWSPKHMLSSQRGQHFLGAVMNEAAGAVSTKVRYPSSRLMFSAPVGRFFFSLRSTHLPLLLHSNLATHCKLSFFILTSGFGMLPFSDIPLKNCLATWVGWHVLVAVTWAWLFQSR